MKIVHLCKEREGEQLTMAAPPTQIFEEFGHVKACPRMCRKPNRGGRYPKRWQINRIYQTKSMRMVRKYPTKARSPVPHLMMRNGWPKYTHTNQIFHGLDVVRKWDKVEQSLGQHHSIKAVMEVIRAIPVSHGVLSHLKLIVSPLANNISSSIAGDCLRTYQ
jgi:hypothetical protein